MTYLEYETNHSFVPTNIKRNDMNRLISTYGGYAIWQLSVHSLYQLAEFVVCQNHEHHTRRIGDNFQSEVLAV